MDPVGQLIGSLLMAFGTLILYGAVKNRRVFGATGIIAQAVTRGSITNLDIPEAFEKAVGTADKSELKAAGTAEKPSTSGADSTSKLDNAYRQIATVDSSLATQIKSRVDVVNPTFSRLDLLPLSQLLLIADVKGLGASTSVIRAHVRGVTGESV